MCSLPAVRVPRWSACLMVCLLLADWSSGQLAGTASRAQAATRVELMIDEPVPDRSVPWPITTGVPFPRGGLSGVEHCRLVDDTGAEQPLQTRVTATWDAARSSVRWLTIDFVAHPGRKYALEFGPDVRRREISTPLRVQPGPVIQVSTGALATDFSAERANALGGVAIDLNGDGRIAPDEVVAQGQAAGEHYYRDQDGQLFSSAADGPERRVTVEESGPVRACVRVDGYYTGPRGERIARYRTRYHFFAGLPLVKVVDELRIIGSTRQTRFGDIGFALDLKVDRGGRTVMIDASGEPGNQVVDRNWSEDTQSISSFQATYRHYGNPECQAGLTETTGNTPRAEPLERVGPWVQVRDRRAAVTGSLRWFWQQFPKEWEITRDQMVLHLWSPRGGELDFGAEGIERFFGEKGKHYLRSGEEGHRRNPLNWYFYHAEEDAIARGVADGLGINKHHEIFLHFAPADRHAEGAQYGLLAAEQPLGLASGDWNCATDVFGPLAARPNDSPYEAIVDRLFDLGRQMQDDFGDYGWWLFGAGPHYSYHWDEESGRFYADSRRFEFHTYGKETQLWWNYVRSGERKFYDWAVPSENHWVDIAVAHEPMKFHCGWRGGVPEERELHWRPGEWSIDSPTHYVRHRDQAEAWLRGGSQFWASYHRTLETTTLAYYFTGDERFNDVLGYWRDYWADLAGKTSRSADVRPWHREQAWFKSTGPGEPEKTWAEMMRDYAPFNSGSRHQMTLFFNLATLYEHTWDEQIGTVLREFADAFLDEDHPIGVWCSQSNRLPPHAEAPLMGHFWVPALWKYTRVTGDPRMKDILARYFDAAYAADPFRADQSVGVYSNTYPAYAYYFTRDPRHLTLAKLELQQLLPFAEPLAMPQDVNRRLYNPGVPIRCFAATPRLIWALQEAEKSGVAVPPAPVAPQRTAIAVWKDAGRELSLTLWGYEPEITLIGPDAKRYGGAKVQPRKYASEIQPFDRTLPEFECYLSRVTVPADAAEGVYVLTPRLELALLNVQPSQTPLWNAARPIGLEPGERVMLPTGASEGLLQLESAQPTSLRVWNGGELLSGKIEGNRATFDLRGVSGGGVAIGVEGRKAWFRLAGRPAEQCWVVPGERLSPELKVPAKQQTLAALEPETSVDPSEPYIAGRFGQAVQITAGNPLRIPDHVVQDGTEVPLFDERQGTIELWVRKLWDERLVSARQATLLTNGVFTVPNRPNLPLNEWAHVAVVWCPYKGDPEQIITYVYINGRDLANYRSIDWPGYSSPRPQPPGKAAQWRKTFLCQALAPAAFAIDELRVSAVARYADPQVVFGPQQTYNPFLFTPPSEPFAPDSDTRLLMHFDGHLKAAVPESVEAMRGK